MKEINREKRNHIDCNIILYVLGLGVSAIVILLFVMTRIIHIDIFSYFPECYFYKKTGYFCFGCGSTRAIKELLKGHFIKSIYYNANIVYVTAVFGWFMSSSTLNFVTRGKITCMKIKPVHAYVILFLSLTQFIVKNTLAYCFHIWVL